MTNDDLRFPIGDFRREDATPENRARHILQIESAPAELRAAVKGLSSPQLDTPYRPGGWTVRQVVHHMPDSHEGRWAELGDNRTTPIDTSLALFESLEQRWVDLLRSLTSADFSRRLRHPERGTISIEDVAAIYAWHGRHHIAHITSLRQRNGW